MDGGGCGSFGCRFLARSASGLMGRSCLAVSNLSLDDDGAVGVLRVSLALALAVRPIR